jgi:hypothetical protein
MGSDGLLAMGALSSFFFLDSIHITEALIAYLREKDSMSALGQKAKYSIGADVFRCTLGSGHSARPNIMAIGFSLLRRQTRRGELTS